MASHRGSGHIDHIGDNRSACLRFLLYHDVDNSSVDLYRTCDAAPKASHTNTPWSPIIVTAVNDILVFVSHDLSLH
jgi:hypothetical protein